MPFVSIYEVGVRRRCCNCKLALVVSSSLSPLLFSCARNYPPEACHSSPTRILLPGDTKLVVL